VRYLAEGRERKSGPLQRISIQLVDTQSSSIGTLANVALRARRS